MKQNDWDACLSKGLKGEAMFKRRCIRFFKPIIHQITYASQPDKQRSGVDVELVRESASIEIKARDKSVLKFNDFLFETKSVIESDKPGWLWTCESDYLVYLVVDWGVEEMLRAHVIFMSEFREWISPRTHLFKTKIAHTKAHGGGWSTENICVPIYSVPNHLFFEIPKHELRDFKQTTLGDFNKE